MMSTKEQVIDWTTASTPVQKEQLNHTRFAEMYLCDFKVDEIRFALDDRLLQYYKETENCDSKYAMQRWKEFIRWAHGYSSEEINRAKQRVNHRIR